MKNHGSISGVKNCQKIDLVKSLTLVLFCIQRYDFFLQMTTKIHFAND